MQSMKFSSSFKARSGDGAGETDLADVSSDLQALKKLYGLFQKINGDTHDEREGHHELDEKSKLMLKKLLDGAAQQAFQNQAKILSYTPSPPPPQSPSKEGTGKGIHSPEEFQNCHLLAHHVKSESHSPHVSISTQSKKEPNIAPGVEPEKGQNQCPVCDTSDLKKQRSGTSMRVLDEKSHRTARDSHDPHRQPHHERDWLDIDRSSRITKRRELGFNIGKNPEKASKISDHVTVAGGMSPPDRNEETRQMLTQQQPFATGACSTLEPVQVMTCQKRIGVGSTRVMDVELTREQGPTQSKDFMVARQQTGSRLPDSEGPRQKKERPGVNGEPVRTDPKLSQTNKPGVITERGVSPRRMGSQKIRATQNTTTLPNQTAENGLNQRKEPLDRRMLLPPVIDPTIQNRKKDQVSQKSGGRITTKNLNLNEHGKPRRQLSRIGKNKEHSHRNVDHVGQRDPPRQTVGGTKQQVGPLQRKDKYGTARQEASASEYSSRSRRSQYDTTPNRRTSSTTRSDTTSSGQKSAGKCSRGGPRMMNRVLTRRGPSPALPDKEKSTPRRMLSHHSVVPRQAAPVERTTRAPPVPGEKPPRRMLSQHGMVGPPRRPAGSTGRTKGDHQKKAERKEGRLRRFKNKLAIIFHHHHHHHHHHHGHVENGEEGGVHPWKYMRRILHHTSKEEKGRLVSEIHGERAAERAPAQHQHGYLHALLEGLLRHVWRSKKRKAVEAERRRLGKARSRLQIKKLHWWQRFRRRRGVKVANCKKPRLRLGFTRAHPQTTKKS